MLKILLLVGLIIATPDALADSHEKTKEAPAFDSSKYDDVMQEIDEEEDLTYFENALHLSGLFETINSGESYTVFAPTNEYFKKMDPELLAKLEAPENLGKLKRFIGHHIVKGNIQLTNFTGNTNRMETISGDVIIAKKLGRNMAVNGRRIMSTDMHPDGVLYLLDGFAVDPTYWEFKKTSPNSKPPKIHIIQ